ncbi:hypothetical protein DH2020_001506 [Rehmannia glutinosa]|uniref:RNase H type-1 domain-containing protein n=1 Tax=Rehmannia glutinosa TaxID=99300 RepID=A0ABR0XZK6_REHGL
MATECTPAQHKSKLRELWTPPPLGSIKINCDASIIKGTGTGVGAVIRDHRGEVIKTIYKLMSTEYEVDIAEAIACREGLTLAKHLGLKSVVLETDSWTIHHKLRHNAHDLSYLGNILQDIKMILVYFDSFSSSFVKRSGNTVAHNLARLAFSLNIPETVIGETPVLFLDIVRAEALAR